MGGSHEIMLWVVSVLHYHMLWIATVAVIGSGFTLPAQQLEKF